MATVQEYLDAYDRQLRTDAETPSAVAVTRLGPLRLVTFAGGRGFVTYRDLGGADGAVIARWVEDALAHYRKDPGITRVEVEDARARSRAGAAWRTRAKWVRARGAGVDHDRRSRSPGG